MYKTAIIAKSPMASPVTAAVTAPVTAVTGPLVVKKNLTADESLGCGVMHLAVIRALDVQERMGGVARVGHRRLKAQWLDTMAEWMDRADDKTKCRPSTPSAVEVSMADAVLEALYELWAKEPFAAKLVVGRALGVKWGQLQRQDERRRGERILAYLRLAALHRMWCLVGHRLQSLLQEVQNL